MIRLMTTALVGTLLANSEASSNSSLRNQQQRELQYFHPCAVPKSEAGGEFFFWPSYIENCFDALPVDETLMYLHIDSLQKTFQQYYCFYNVVNDPAKSGPINYQQELGWTLFGEGEGQVQLDAELTALKEDVWNNGATMATFWELNTIFQKLRDHHVELPDLAGTASLAQGHYIAVYPARDLSETTEVYGEFSPSYDESGDFQLAVVWDYPTGTVKEMVETINGVSPYDFYLSLVTNDAADFPIQSIGARMNNAFQSFTFGIIRSVGRPTDVLPEKFSVRYMSGEEETYYTVVQLNTITDYAYDMLSSIPSIDTPGAAFKNFDVAMFRISEVFTSTQAQERNTPTIEAVVPRQSAMQEDYVWDAVVTVSGTRAIGIRMEDDYALFKIGSFQILRDDGGIVVVEAWSNFTAAAKAKGIKKAIIDISGNEGGFVVSGQLMAISMFPFAPFGAFTDTWDMNYNDSMKAYIEFILPLLERLTLTISSMTDLELQGTINTLPNADKQLLVVAGVLVLFCCESSTTPETCDDPRCVVLSDYYLAIQRLDAFPTGPQLRNVITKLLQAISYYNPFTVGGNNVSFDPEVVRQVTGIRGGVPTNLTTRKTFIPSDDYNEAALRSFQNDYFFDEYVIVGDGTGGSTTCIFSSAAQQLWKNSKISGARTKLTTVTYGGTKEPSDTTLAGYPASVKHVNVGYPIITSSLFQSLQFLVDANLKDRISLMNEKYAGTLVTPPYFADSLPFFPVVNYYDPFMEPGALPLQYVKMPADKHIQKIYTATQLANSGDLAALYADVAKEGFSAAPDTEPPIDATESENIFDHAEIATSKPTEAPTTSKPTEAPTTSKPTEAPTTSKPTEAPTSMATTIVAPTSETTDVAPTSENKVLLISTIVNAVLLAVLLCCICIAASMYYFQNHRKPQGTNLESTTHEAFGLGSRTSGLLCLGDLEKHPSHPPGLTTPRK